MSTQQEAIDLINTGANVFVTGGAGRGKSHVIRQVTDKNTILAAPTGIASLNIGGATCHRTFGLPIGLPTTSDYATISSKARKLLSNKNLKRIIIDEIGMVRADTLEIINHRLQQARGNSLPFGGVQMVVVGDFFQLSPIVSAREKQLFYKNYATSFAFGADAWNFVTVELEKAYRQDNDIHVKVLDSFRKKDKWSKRAFEWLEENTLPYSGAGEDMLHLCCFKDDAARINQIHYNRLTTKEHTFYGETNNSKWSNDVAVPEIVKLREGAHVIIRANDPDGAYTNGQRGIVKKLYASSVIVTIETNGVEEDVEVVPFTWETYAYNATAKGLTKEVEWMYSQIPLQLGWAITIHSAQGMTLDGVAVDVGRGCFAHGMLYVALSRAKDLTNMSIASPISMSDLIVDPEVKQFYGVA